MYQQFSVDIERIKVQFSKLTTAVGKSIANHVELIAHVLSMGILSGRDEDDMLLANSTSDAMVVLTKYLSFIDHQPLESIIDTMCGDAERQMLLIYCEDLKEFCQRRVRIAAPTATDVEHADKESIHILFDLNDPVLRCVKNLRVSIANILECPASAIVLHGIRDSGKVGKLLEEYSGLEGHCRHGKINQGSLVYRVAGNIGGNKNLAVGPLNRHCKNIANFNLAVW